MSLALSSINAVPLASGWLSKWGTTMFARTSSLYFRPVNVPSNTCKSSLQSWEKHAHTVTEPPPNALVPTILSWSYAVFLNLQTRNLPSTWCNKNMLSSDQWIRRHLRSVQLRRARAHSKRASLCLGGQRWTLDLVYLTSYRRHLAAASQSAQIPGMANATSHVTDVLCTLACVVQVDISFDHLWLKFFVVVLDVDVHARFRQPR